MDIDECKTNYIKLAQRYEPGSQDWVRVTHVNNPHNFYVRPTKFNAILSNLESYIPTEKPNQVSLQQRVIFEITSSSARYLRGQIFNVDETGNEIKCDIFAFDYGDIHKLIPLNNIWMSTNINEYIPPLALQCQLANCSPPGGGDWSDDAVEAFKYNLGDERAKMIVVDNLANKLVVEMINSCPNDVATLLALTGYSTLGYNHNIMPAKKDFYPIKKMTVNETLHVRMLHGVSMEEFYVAEVNDYSKYLNNREMITQKTKKEKGLLEEHLHLDLPVCVLDKLRKSERALVKSIIPSKSEAIVQLVDTGKEVKAHTVNMRYVPKEGLTYPPCAIFCSAAPHQQIGRVLRKFLQPGYQFLITIKELGDQFDFPNIVSINLLGKQ